MIEAKPQFNTQFSVLSFIGISLCVFVYGLVKTFHSPGIDLLYIFITVVSGIMGFVVLLRMIAQYKTITVKQKTFYINFPIFRKKYKYPLEDLTSWNEIEIKTYKTTFLHLEMIFKGTQKVGISNKEYSDYVKLKSYLQKTSAKKKIDLG